jgi:hypothetical protein
MFAGISQRMKVSLFGGLLLWMITRSVFAAALPVQARNACLGSSTTNLVFLHAGSR